MRRYAQNHFLSSILCDWRKIQIWISRLPTNLRFTGRARDGLISKVMDQRHTKEIYDPWLHVFASLSRADSPICQTLERYHVLFSLAVSLFFALFWPYPQATRVVHGSDAPLAVGAHPFTFGSQLMPTSSGPNLYIYTLHIQVLGILFLLHFSNCNT